MSQPHFVSCRAVDSGAALFRELQHAVAHRVSCDIDPYEDGAVEAELLLSAIDSVRLLVARAVAPDTPKVAGSEKSEFRRLEQAFESAQKANLRVFVGQRLAKSHEVNWDNAIALNDRPSLGPAAEVKAVLVHVSKSVESMIDREVSGL
jgi:hypothetical protein